MQRHFTPTILRIEWRRAGKNWAEISRDPSLVKLRFHPSYKPSHSLSRINSSLLDKLDTYLSKNQLITYAKAQGI